MEEDQAYLQVNPSPQQFVDIKYSQGELRLITKEGEHRKLSQISTGQKTALALSIFLSLNRMLRDAAGHRILMTPYPL
jgi:DNA repair exonuclease SbcCD ATPase subunit